MRRPCPTKTRTQQQGAGGVSLFPFLAVLICTMGSLIVLLVVLARQARLQAAEAARAVAAKATVDLDEIKAQRELAQWQALQLKESRTKTEADLTEARLKLGGVEDHIPALRDEIAKLEAAWRELDQIAAGGAQQRSQIESELARLKAEIAVAGKRLAEEWEAARKRRNSYAVVPYQGRNQTHRRPIYIECRADGVVLQPEGIVFTEADFEGPMEPGNPLAAALRASREYLVARGPPGPDAPDEPYPLLLVRPDGIAAYYAARAAMESWGSEFGYELIGQEWNLKFPPADAEMARVVTRAVEAARQRQELLARIAPRHAGRRDRPVYRAGPRGMVRDDAPGYADATRLPARPGPPGFGGPGHPSDAAGYARQPHSRVFGSRFGSGADHPAGGQDAGQPLSPGEGLGRASPPLPLGEGRGEGSRRAGTAESPHPNPLPEGEGTGYAARRPEDYVSGRPAEEQVSPGADALPLRPGEWRPSPPPSSKRSPGDAKDSAPERRSGLAECSLAEMRGRNWGLPDTSGGAIPITRPIRVDCLPDRLVIAPQSKQGCRVVHLGPRTRNSVDEMVSAVWDHMDTWGIAGRGMYWRPVLSIRVAPGAEGRYKDLNVLLKESGLRVERRKDE